MEKRREFIRLMELFALMAAVFLFFLFLLYDLQVVHRGDYETRTVKSIGRTETVPAARGEINDCYGRSLISNQVAYQVTLDTAAMGDRRNQIILELIHLAQDHEVVWPDNLPLSTTDPCYFRLGSFSDYARSNYVKLSQLMGWTHSDGPGLLAELRSSYKIKEDVSDPDARLLAGVLYELSLRSREVIWSPYIFASGVDIRFISAVRERNLPGVSIDPAATRRYDTTYAAHLLGRTGLMDNAERQIYKDQGYAMNETVGKDGVEKAFEPILRGTSGTRTVERNTNGKIVSQTWQTEPQPGDTVFLTIDLPLQQKVEEVLAEKLPRLTSTVQGGAAVVLDVKDASVKAIASYPTYDLTQIYSNATLYKETAENPLRPFYNRATMGRYSPGSTFKMLVAAGALEEGIIEPGTKIEDTGLYTYYGDSNPPACWIYREYRSTHGTINVSRAIEVSCNVFFYDVGRRLGIQKINEYAKLYGLGQSTGIEIPEYQGTVAGPEYAMSQGQAWYEGNVLSVSIGQENNQFTPLQLANYVATLVNGGVHHAAHLLKSVKSGTTGEITEIQPQVINTVELAPENLAAIKQGMLDLTTTGSLAGYFQDLPFKVGAKTGSAQVANSTSNAVFVCFAPYDDPQVAIALVAEKGGSGSGLAELAADILQFYFSSQTAYSTAVEENTLLR